MADMIEGVTACNNCCDTTSQTHVLPAMRQKFCINVHCCGCKATEGVCVKAGSVITQYQLVDWCELPDGSKGVQPATAVGPNTAGFALGCFNGDLGDEGGIAIYVEGGFNLGLANACNADAIDFAACLQLKRFGLHGETVRPTTTGAYV